MSSATHPSPPRIWLAVAPALVVPTLGSLSYFVLFSGTPLGQAILIISKSFLLIWPALATLLILHRPILPPKPNRLPLSHHLKAIPLGVATGLAISAVVGIAMLSPLRPLIDEAAPNIARKVEHLGFADHYILLALILSLANSAIEEYYWRWFAYGNLRHVLKPRFLAHLVAAIAFSSHHFVVTSQFFAPTIAILLGTLVGVGGAIWSVMFQRQQSLLGAWISHVIIDLAIMAVGYTLLSPLLILILILILLLLLLLLVIVPAISLHPLLPPQKNLHCFDIPKRYNFTLSPLHCRPPPLRQNIDECF